MYTVTSDRGGRFVVSTPYEALDILRRVPDQKVWNAKERAWKLAASRVNLAYLREKLPQLTWDEAALAVARRVEASNVPPVAESVDDYAFADPPPYAHQREVFGRSRSAPAFALLMEQRTGKTRVFIDTVTDQFLKSQLDIGVVICPNSVKETWDEQIPQWTPKHVPIDVHVYKSGDKPRAALAAALAAARPGRLQWVVINVEALSHDKTFKWTADLLRGKRVAMGIDEASRIKHPSAMRTKNILKLGSLAKLRRILTGTLITQSPLDAFAPFKFLDAAILGYKSYYAFRADYAILGGYGGHEVVEYVNVDKLAQLIKPFSARVTRDQCFDLPPKQYDKVMVDLAPEQRRMYNQMRDEMLTEMFAGGPQVSATIVLTQLLRLQQIVGGFIPPVKPPPDLVGEELAAWLRVNNPVALPIPGPNPKLEALLEELEEENTGKVAIWARFRPEIAMIANALRNVYGQAAVAEFHGGIAVPDRTIVRRNFAFNNDDRVTRFVVAQQQTGGVGLDFAGANSVWYYSNTFSLEDRLQTEDRFQHGSKTTAVSYMDLLAHDTIDVKRILPALRGKKVFADMVSGDEVKQWI